MRVSLLGMTAVIDHSPYTKGWVFLHNRIRADHHIGLLMVSAFKWLGGLTVFYGKTELITDWELRSESLAAAIRRDNGVT